MENKALPKKNLKFTYTLCGYSRDGYVTDAWFDSCGNVIVEVAFDDGQLSTFENSEFLGQNLSSDEKIEWAF